MVSRIKTPILLIIRTLPPAPTVVTDKRTSRSSINQLSIQIYFHFITLVQQLLTMQLTVILSVLLTCASTATAAVAGMEPMYLRMGAMKKRDTFGPVKRGSPEDHDPPNGKNKSSSRANVSKSH